MLFAAVFGALYAPLVMTGLHHMTNAIDTQLVNNLGYTTLWPMIALSNIAQGSAVVAMSVLQKNNERAQQVNIPAFISCYLGVTEPALFGVNLKYKFPLVCGMIGSACAAMVCTGFGVQALSIGVGGLPGILSIVFNFWGVFAACMAVAVVVPFALTYLVGMRQLSEKDRGLAASSEGAGEKGAKTVAAADADSASAPSDRVLLAPLSGAVMPITEMPDQVFASKAMGDGLAIEPAAGEDTVVAPADATVAATMPGSFHAIGLTLDDGMELLIHVGIDTVDMGGDGFSCLVEQGQRVRAGQPLMTFSAEKIHAAGHPAITAFIVTDEGSAEGLALLSGMDAEAGGTTVATYRS